MYLRSYTHRDLSIFTLPVARSGPLEAFPAGFSAPARPTRCVRSTRTNTGPREHATLRENTPPNVMRKAVLTPRSNASQYLLKDCYSDA